MFSKVRPIGRYGLSAIACLTVALAGCGPGPGENEAQGNAAAPAAQPLPDTVASVSVPALDREALLLAIARAASAAGAGIDDTKTQAELDGRSFTFRMRFGCGGAPPDQGDGPMAWSYDGEKQTLRVVATPDVNPASPLIKAVSGPEVEAVQGFWVQQPWLFKEACRLTAGGPPNTGQPEAGLAQFFTAEQSRVERRSRPFETVQKLPPEGAPGEGGLDLVLSGRLKKLPDGRVIKCAPLAPNSRPSCVASVEFDRVVVEHPGTGAPVAEWGLG